MIAYLAGTIRSIDGSTSTIVTGPIGYAVHVPSRYAFSVGAHVELEVYTHITQDAGMQLYGFQTADERTLFGLILGCSGIGPKVALSVINSLHPAAFASAIMAADVRALSKIDGVGAKKAETLIMHLKGKIAKLPLSPGGELTESAQRLKQLSDALGALGYTHSETNRALEHVRADAATASFDVLLRKALVVSAKV